MKKRIFALLMAVVMILSLAACQGHQEVVTDQTVPTNTTDTINTTEPAEPETAQIISNIRWLVDCDTEELSCQYNDQTNTLKLSGDGFYPVEILFFEGTAQVHQQTVWDEEGNIYTQQEYNENGQLIFEQDCYGYRKYCEYDGMLPVKETVYQEVDRLYSTTTRAYDDAGREIYYKEVIEDGEEYSETYRAYDEDGNLISYRANSHYVDQIWYQLTTHTYEDGRLISSTYETDDPGSSWEYSVTYTYDDQGRKVGAVYQDAVNGEAQDTYVYDDQNHLLLRTEHYPADDGWIEAMYEYAYDEQGNLLKEYYLETSLSSSEVYYCETTEYTYGQYSSNPTKIVISGSAEEVYTYLNEYDSDGNLIKEVQLIDGEEISSQSFTYDKDGKLVQINQNGEEVFTGDDIQFVTGEDHADFYMTATYENTTNVSEAAAVNEFILQYIQEFC